MKTKVQSEITQATIARGTDKITHETFYVVRSDSSDAWHHITWNNARIAWECDGEHCQYQAGGTTCKHTKAVLDVLRARRARIALAMGGETPAIVAKMQAEEDAKLAEQAYASRLHNGVSYEKYSADVERENSAESLARREYAALNGTREFNLMR